MRWLLLPSAADFTLPRLTRLTLSRVDGKVLHHRDMWRKGGDSWQATKRCRAMLQYMMGSATGAEKPRVAQHKGFRVDDQT